MKNTPPVPANEKERLAALKRYNILDTLSEPEFDDVVSLISYICQVPIAHVSFIDENRQWFKSMAGFEDVEVDRETTFCQYTILEQDIWEIPDTHQNEIVKNSEHVTDGLKIRFYAGIPITTPDGYNIGTICAIDQVPKKLNKEQKTALSTLARHVIALLELRIKNEELDLQTKIAEKAVSAKDRFLANMSHEIRTPLNAIIGFTELLSQDRLTGHQQEYVTNVKTAGENLLGIVNDVLDLSKIESGNLIIESYPFNLKLVLKHVHELLKVKVAQGVDFNLFIDPDLPETVLGDKGRLTQILMNLAGNALKFTQQGEVTVSAKMISETKEKYAIKFSVKDTGIGISKDKLNKVFERFTQAEESTTREFGGTGLGLNIVKQLIELQNSEITVNSELGRGSDFSFSLDFDKVSTAPAASAEETAKPKPEKLSILLCEDNVLNQNLAKSVIEGFGYTIDIANNGQEGIHLLEKNEYDIILMDIQMPVKDGYETTQYIRSEMKLSTPIIAMTAHSLIGEQQKCFNMGMNGYIPKPFKQADLLNTIRFALEKKDNEAEVNFSYLNEMSGRNPEFIKEMIGIFVTKIPEELESLEGALNSDDYDLVKKITHNMRSSLSLFMLEELFACLNPIEKEALTGNFTTESHQCFSNLKNRLIKITSSLKKNF